MAEPLFSLTNVSFSYPGGIPALSDISLAINKGERTAFIGANGTGKSTLLTLLDALIFPKKGTLRFAGEEITQQSMNDTAFQRNFRKKVGFVFQNPDIQLFCPTVREDILFGPLQLGIPRDELLYRFGRTVELLKLTPLLERSPHNLSLGEKKKVAIASVFVIEPEVLLLDEPTAGLDPQTMRDIIAAFQHAHEAGKTVVFATHDLHIVEEIADTIHVFGSSRGIKRSGTPEEILSDKEFLQKNNLAHIHVHRHVHASHMHEH
ncbi:MAG: ABC transporter ATP-binding protein [Chitinispirillaceae bacterium]|jgi:cobalt/nickel transport system ATP-binding protein